jgi:hypothetical protein
MSWQDTTNVLLRVSINDLDETAYRFTDDRLEQILVVAMWRVQQDEPRAFDAFTVDVVNVSVTPDPTVGADRNDSFVNLAVANAACLNDRGAVLLAADQALRVKDVGSEVDLRDVFKAKLAVLKDGWCETYKKMLAEYRRNSGDGVAGAAIMTPFRAYGGAYRRRAGFGLY